jgi:hypothetical protein
MKSHFELERGSRGIVVPRGFGKCGFGTGSHFARAVFHESGHPIIFFLKNISVLPLDQLAK